MITGSSPDEFTGGPTELFAEVTAHNPTFYADTLDPQSLNKYTYCLNNPLKFVDPDGHQAKKSDVLAFWGVLATCQACQREVARGVLKELGNIRIGMKNSSPFVTGGPTPYNEPDNMFQDFGMTVTEHVTVLASFLGGKGPANVVVAEGEGAAVTTAVATEAGTAARVKPPGPTVDPNTGAQVGRFVGDSKGNVMIEPTGGKTVPAGKNGIDTHTTYPNGSNYQRLNPQGHANNPQPHGHGHLQGTGTGKKGQGPSIDNRGKNVPFNSKDAHWDIH